MTNFDPGDVVLLRFPFTDLLSSEKRPAVVISPREHTNIHHDLRRARLDEPGAGGTGLSPRSVETCRFAKANVVEAACGTVSMVIVERRMGKSD